MTADAHIDDRPARTAKRQEATRRSAFWPMLFIFTLALPVSYYFGPVRLSPYRILLMAMLLPCFFMWISGKAGKIRSCDIYILLYLAWSSLSIFLNMGNSGFEPAGMLVIETLGAYLLARCFVRDAATFRSTVKFFFLIVVFLLPFAAAEAILKQPILYNLFRLLGSVTPPTDMEMRMGMRRAQGSLEHPILFGVFCSAALSLAYYSYGRAAGGFWGSFRAGTAFLATFFSLSTGAYLSAMVQLMLIGWDRVTRTVQKRWKILGAIVIVGYILVDSLSNRSPFQVFISYLTFNQHNSYNRVLTWIYGTQHVMNHPWIGGGLGLDWIRPWWMNPSVDNFWLVVAMRHGLPAIAFLMLAIAAMMRQVTKLDLETGEVDNARKGLLITLAGLSFAICSVHLWNASYVLFIFLIGCGPWMLDHVAAAGEPRDSPQQNNGKRRP